MGSNRNRTGNPADMMGGRSLGWGTRAENKEMRKSKRHTANHKAIKDELEPSPTPALPRTQPTRSTMSDAMSLIHGNNRPDPTPEQELEAVGAEVPTVTVEHVGGTTDVPDYLASECCGDGSCGAPELCATMQAGEAVSDAVDDALGKLPFDVLMVPEGTEVLVTEAGDADRLLEALGTTNQSVISATRAALLGARASALSAIALIGALVYLVLTN